jgi:hypothetical protein
MKHGRWIIPLVIGLVGVIIIGADVVLTDPATRSTVLGSVILAVLVAVICLVSLKRHRMLLAACSTRRGFVDTKTKVEKIEAPGEEAKVEVTFEAHANGTGMMPSGTSLTYARATEYIEDFVSYVLQQRIGQEKRPQLFTAVLADNASLAAENAALRSRVNDDAQLILSAHNEVTKLIGLNKEVAATSTELEALKTLLKGSAKELHSAVAKVRDVIDAPTHRSQPVLPAKVAAIPKTGPDQCDYCQRHVKKCGELTPLDDDLWLSADQVLKNPSLCDSCILIHAAGVHARDSKESSTAGAAPQTPDSKEVLV